MGPKRCRRHPGDISGYCCLHKFTTTRERTKVFGIFCEDTRELLSGPSPYRPPGPSAAAAALLACQPRLRTRAAPARHPLRITTAGRRRRARPAPRASRSGGLIPHSPASSTPAGRGRAGPYVPSLRWLIRNSGRGSARCRRRPLPAVPCSASAASQLDCVRSGSASRSAARSTGRASLLRRRGRPPGAAAKNTAAATRDSDWRARSYPSLGRGKTNSKAASPPRGLGRHEVTAPRIGRSAHWSRPG